MSEFPRSLEFGPPKIVGRMSHRQMRGIRRMALAYDNERPELFWEVERNMQKLGALKPLAKIVIQAARDEGFNAQAIGFDLDITDVGRKRSQRPSEWHVDGLASERPAYIVADSLPTEFLIVNALKNDAVRGWLKDSLIQRLYYTGDYDIDEEIPGAENAVYRPNPYEIVMLGSHIHRSPINRKRFGKIRRTWVRATVL